MKYSKEVVTLLLELLNQFKETLPLSPLRSSGKKPISPPADNLEAVEKNLDKVIENLERKLSLVLMGEVKAGKSTLINALAGGKISPTNTLECTSAIIEIEYSAEPFAEIHTNDGNIDKKSFEEALKILEEQKQNEAFFRNCKMIKIGYPLPNLKRLRLVDTPGLSTITQQNEETTKNYIMSSDLVLWVLNAFTLGDAEVTEKLSEVAKTGKPIVIILNRIDQVDSDPERLIDYVKDEYSIYSEKVFAISAEQAFQAVITNDEELKQKSGFSSLIEYLEKQVDSMHDKVKTESVISSAGNLLRTELLVHTSYMKHFDFVESQLTKYKNDINLRAEKICCNLENWLKARVYGNEGEGLLNHFQSFSSDKETILKKIESNIKKWWDKVSEELNKKFKEEWEISEKEYASRFGKEFNNFIEKMNNNDILTYSYSYVTYDKKINIFSNAFKDLRAGGIAGLCVSALMSVLGGFSFLSTLPVVLPISLLTTVAVNVLNNVKNKDTKETIMETKLEPDIDRTREVFISEFLEKQVFPEIKEKSNNVIDSLCQKIADSLLNGFSKSDIINFKNAMHEYISNLKKLADEFSSNFNFKIDAENTDCLPVPVTTNSSKENKDKGKFIKIVKEKGIEHLVHFTNFVNLKSILENGLVSVDYQKKHNISAHINDPQRLDGHTDAVSLSISFPNYKMFYKVRKDNEGEKWAVLLLEPSIIWEKECAFNKHNAASNESRKLDLEDRKSIEAFLAMFSDDELRSKLGLPDNYTTDPQAEILVFDKIEPEYIKAIVVENEIDKKILQLSYRIPDNLIVVNREFFYPRFDWEFWQEDKGDN